MFKITKPLYLQIKKIIANIYAHDALFGFFLAIVLTFIVFWKIFSGLLPIPQQLLEYYGWTGSNAKPYITTDVISQIIPYKLLVVASLKSFSVSLWNPYIFLGMPSLASVQGAGLYPLNMLSAFLSFHSYFTILIMSQIALAFFFTYLLLRLWVSKPAAILGGLSFSLSSYYVAWLEWGTIGSTFLWLPMICWSGIRYIQTQRLRYLWFGAFSLAFAVFAGHMQFAIFVFMFSGLTILCYWLFESRRMSVGIGVIGMFLLGGLLAAPQLLPSLELSTLANRVSVSYVGASKLLDIKEFFIKAISPFYYGGNQVRGYLGTRNYNEFTNYVGLVPLIFLPAAFLSKHKKYVIVFVVISILAVMFAAGHIIYYPVQLVIFPLQKLLPLRFLMVYSFYASLVLAIGFDAYLTHSGKGAKMMTIIFGLILLAISLSLKVDIVSSILAATVVVLLLESFLNRGYINKSLIFIVLVLCFCDLMLCFNKVTVYDKYETQTNNVAYEAIVRDGGKDSRLLTYPPLDDTNMYYDLPSATGYDSLQTSRTRKLFDKVEGRSTSNTNTIDTTNFGSSVYDALNIKYFLSKTARITFNYPVIFEDSRMRVYRKDTNYGRVYIRDQVVFRGNEQERLEKVASVDLSKAVVLDKDIRLDDTKALDYKIIDTTYTNEKISLKVSTNKPSILILADSYFPGWKVNIDGKMADINEANYALRGVYLPTAGVHSVVFSYQPNSFRIGVILACLGLSVMGSHLLLKLISAKNKRHLKMDKK